MEGVCIEPSHDVLVYEEPIVVEPMCTVAYACVLDVGIVQSEPVVDIVETEPVVAAVETEPVVAAVETEPVVAAVETETVMDPRRFLMGPFQLHDPNSTTQPVAAVPLSSVTPEDTTTHEDASTYIANKRPRRAAAIVAEQRVCEVLKWEKCKESSNMFKDAAVQINAEFDRVGRGGRKYVPVSVGEVQVPVDMASSPVVSIDPSALPVEIPSDDEGAAEVDCPDVDMHNDNDDDLDNDEDECGSLASFVVSDSYMSEVGAVSDAGSVNNESESDSESGGGCDSASDSDSDGGFSCAETDSDCDSIDQCKWSDEPKA
jgi:hypothetical protein